MTAIAAPQNPPSFQQPTSSSSKRGAFFVIALLPLIFLFLTSRRFTPAADVLTLTHQLVNIPSPSGCEQRALQHAKNWFVARGWQVVTHPVPPSFALLATLAPPSSVRVLLSTHLDVVPGPPQSRVEGERLYGRGAVDAKGQAASLMIAAASLADERVAVLLVPREESDHAGMAAAHAFGLPRNITLINAEPTEAKLAEKQKGMLKVNLKAKGVSAHSGYPNLGRSAIHSLVKVVSAIVKKWPDSGETTVNVGIIQGGTASNVLAREATATVLWRVATTVSELVLQLENILSEYDHISYEIISRNEPLEFFAPPKAAARFGTCHVAYNTDVPHYKGGYKKAVLFGAGSIEQAHTEDEWVYVEQLEKMPKQLEAIISELLHTY
ncbi:unnamed protein product [Agarophyton chilense]